jgi:hypothetical protein
VLRAAPILIAVLAVGMPACGGTSNATFTAAKTQACLESHHVLVSPIEDAAPPVVKARTEILASFAMLPGQALDNATLIFTSSPADASSGAKAWFDYDHTEAARGPGIYLPPGSKTRFDDLFSVRGNVLVEWHHGAPKQAARRIVLGCLE